MKINFETFQKLNFKNLEILCFDFADENKSQSITFLSILLNGIYFVLNSIKLFFKNLIFKFTLLKSILNDDLFGKLRSDLTSNNSTSGFEDFKTSSEKKNS
jgi:hypothetical protein